MPTSLKILLLSGLLACSSLSATAQEIVLPLPDQLVPDHPVPVLNPRVLVGPGPACLAAGPDFFVISSRECPQEWDSRHASRLRYYRPCSHGQFHLSSREAFQQWLQPGVPLCIVVHGSMVSWEYVRTDSMRTYPWLRNVAPDQPLQVAFFTWPSDQFDNCLPVRLELLGDNSSLNGLFLAHLLTSIPPDHPVCLVGHSHGCRQITTALHLLSGGTAEGCSLGRNYAQGRRIRAVFAAAAVDHHWMNPGKRYDLALYSTESVLNLRTRHDYALWLYPLGSVQRPLGWSGLTDRDVRKLGALSRKLCEFDVTDLVGTGHNWEHYYHEPRIAYKMMYYVYFNEPR